VARVGRGTVKSQIIEPCAMKSEIPFSRMEPKKQKHSPFPPTETEKKNFFFLTLLREESPTT